MIQEFVFEVVGWLAIIAIGLFCLTSCVLMVKLLKEIYEDGF